ncbi:hypothetical protein [Pedobacter steynii]|uniref:Uncharacterized protein n=1 Tax=Pedobacter steynii TaxID=430522 RepID=A0A1D7QLZ9_9SPHI|nr:hypothetical protein [Pedobacter steynii]AOM79696.1 hypothetical protein BFS30_22570 [Pedobacter steynii]
MSSTDKKKAQTYVEQLKQKASEQENYGAEIKYEQAHMLVCDCPECGAGRALVDGLTICAYCGFKFMTVKLSNGIHIKKTNNS